MSPNENPFLVTCEHLAHSLQTHLLHFIFPTPPLTPSSNSNNINRHPQFSLSSSTSTITTPTKTTTVPETNKLTKSANPVTKEELGRATWTLLHTLAAQLPERPTRQQKKDVKELMAILSRLYPCRECADHFKDVLRGLVLWEAVEGLKPETCLYLIPKVWANPVQAGSQAEFSQWLCHVHNVVNRSLGKLAFPCQRIDARWGKLECLERACDLEGASTEYRRS